MLNVINIRHANAPVLVPLPEVGGLAIRLIREKKQLFLCAALDFFVTLNSLTKILINVLSKVYTATKPRAYSRILKVAHNIADFAGSDKEQSIHIAQAIGHRNLDRGDWAEKGI